MWNELGGAAVADGDGLTTSHVVHVGRSWFRMTPVMSTATKTDPIGLADSAGSDVKMGASLFEHASSPSIADENYENEGGSPGKPWGTITLSWWGLGLAAAGLMVIGAALSVAMMQRHLVVLAAPAPAPVAAPAAVPVPPARPTAEIEPLPAPKSVVAEPSVAAAVSRPVQPVSSVAAAPTRAPAAGVVPREPIKRPVTPPVKRVKPAARGVESSAPAEKPWVDPFAD